LKTLLSSHLFVSLKGGIFDVWKLNIFCKKVLFNKKKKTISPKEKEEQYRIFIITCTPLDLSRVLILSSHRTTLPSRRLSPQLQKLSRELKTDLLFSLEDTESVEFLMSSLKQFKTAVSITSLLSPIMQVRLFSLV